MSNEPIDRNAQIDRVINDLEENVRQACDERYAKCHNNYEAMVHGEKMERYRERTKKIKNALWYRITSYIEQNTVKLIKAPWYIRLLWVDFIPDKPND